MLYLSYDQFRNIVLKKEFIETKIYNQVNLTNLNNLKLGT